MPQFKFIAVDSNGSSKRGVVEALNETAALARIAKKGWTATQITAAGALPAEADATPVTKSAGSPWYVEQKPVPEVTSHIDNPNASAVDAKSSARRGMLPLVISSAALIVAVIALLLNLLRDPLGSGISSYDFSSAEAGAKSMIQIEANKDIRASIELELLKDGNRKDMIRTLDINRTADFADKKIVFVSYMQNGKKHKLYIGFEKDLDSKLWFPRYISFFDVRKTNEQLAKEMEAWNDKDPD